MSSTHPTSSRPRTGPRLPGSMARAARRPGSLAPLLALIALLSPGCGPGAPATPHVIVLSLDTLRADHLGSYGDERGLTPHLDDFARTATRYAFARATAPWTVPTHASLFTGRLPFEHGAHSLPIEEGLDNVRPLPPDLPTLAEVLARRGYATGGFVANAVYLNPRYGLSRGFETWEVARERAARLNGRALDWVDEVLEEQPDRPLLLFVNYLDTHRPYDVTPAEGEREYLPTEFPAVLLDRLIETVMVQGGEDPELEALVREQYARSVRNLDRALGEFFKALEERGILERAVVVVTSDHGEYFGEHGLVEHSKDVYEEALAVPLLVRAPGQAEGRVREERTSLAALPSLVLEHLPEGDGGTFPRRAGEGLVLAENHYSRPGDVLHPVYGPRFRRVRTAVYSGPWKFIHSSDGRHELYPIEAGRVAEDRDRAAEQRELVAELAAKVEELLERGRWQGEQRGAGHLTPELEAEMRALGYVGDEPPR